LEKLKIRNACLLLVLGHELHKLNEVVAITAEQKGNFVVKALGLSGIHPTAFDDAGEAVACFLGAEEL
jgi:hypothetical protein